MTKTIILHVGLHKTGSTSIQASLDTHSAQLAKNSIHYPQIPVNGNVYPNHSFMLFSMFTDKPVRYHMNQRFGFTTEEQVEALNAYYHSALIEAINTSQCDTTILSGEDVSSLSKAQLYKLKAFFTDNIDKNIEFKVVIYFRHLLDYTQSVIQQRVKDGGWEDLLLDELKKGRLSSVKQRVEKFIDVFGLECIQAYKFEEAIKETGSISGQFARDVLDYDIEHSDTLHTNKSLSFEAYQIHSKVNASEPLYINGKINPQRRVDDLLPIVSLVGQKLALGDKFSPAFRKGLEEEFAWVEQHFGIVYDRKTLLNVDISQAWSLETLCQLESIYPKLSSLVQRHVVDLLREVAISLEKSHLEKALEMMQVAAKLRPNGQLIHRKVIEYMKTLKDSK